jgi:O-6-methylguanine DNA methyltransferase
MAKKRIPNNEAPISIGQTGKTPLGKLWLAVSENGLAGVAAGVNREQFEGMLQRRYKRGVVVNEARLREAAAQVSAYLGGKRRAFDLPIDWTGLRPFQQSVLRATLAIPYGETRTYSEIAAEVGRQHAARAVGRAEACNPMPLVIPCHRVIGRDGKLHGYGMGEGLKTKEWLLKLEGAVMA